MIGSVLLIAGLFVLAPIGQAQDKVEGNHASHKALFDAARKTEKKSEPPKKIALPGDRFE